MMSIDLTGAHNTQAGVPGAGEHLVIIRKALMDEHAHVPAIRRPRHGLIFTRAPSSFLPVLMMAAALAACGSTEVPSASSPLSPVAVAPSGSSEPSDTAPTPGAGAASPPAQPSPTRNAVPILQPPAFASRVTVPELAIDLPVVSGDLQPPPAYPLCDVAAYITRFGQPYEPGITYLSAHAQEGMFLPLLEASLQNNGRSLVGLTAYVYTNDGQRYGYRVDRVIQHVTDYSEIANLPVSERFLVLQTSEGPYGTTAKLQVVASALDETTVELAEATPEPRPRDCRPLGPGGDPDATATPEPTASPLVVAAPTPPLAPVDTPAPTPPPDPLPSGFSPVPVASRVTVRDLGINLPVVSGDLQPPPNYPFCDVAAYVTFLSQPGAPGVTYISAHAQEGMFLPLLEASLRRDGREMLGLTADVYTSDGLRYTYEIWQVHLHVIDRAFATAGLQPDEQRLVLQTSEGPYGTNEKLAVTARLVSIERVDLATAVPQANPRDCRPPELGSPEG